MKKPGFSWLLLLQISHILDLSEGLPIVLFNLFTYSLYFLQSAV